MAALEGRLERIEQLLIEISGSVSPNGSHRADVNSHSLAQADALNDR
jgi:hypothetical protein